MIALYVWKGKERELGAEEGVKLRALEAGGIWQTCPQGHAHACHLGHRKVVTVQP